MTRTRSLFATLTFVASLAVAGAAFAADPPAPQPPDQGQQHWRQRFQERMGLTDDQMQQLHQVNQQNAVPRRQNYQALRQAQSELRRLVLTGADQAAIEAKQLQVQQLMNQSVELRVKTLREIAPILTPEQREKFAELSERRGGHRHFRHHPHPDRQSSPAPSGRS